MLFFSWRIGFWQEIWLAIMASHFIIYLSSGRWCTNHHLWQYFCFRVQELLVCFLFWEIKLEKQKFVPSLRTTWAQIENRCQVESDTHMSQELDDYYCTIYCHESRNVINSRPQFVQKKLMVAYFWCQGSPVSPSTSSSKVDRFQGLFQS